MATINEDFVSFKTAKSLKEKGFNGKYFAYYIINKEIDDNNPCWLGAPTQTVAMKWLREIHHLYIQIMLDSYACGGHMGYYVVIQNTHSDFEMMLQDALDDVFYDTYEEAAEAAIKYCLENLI